MFTRRVTPPPVRKVSRNDQYVSRAIAAYYRVSGSRSGVFPSREWSRIEWHMGREYVILANPRAVLAVYRVRAYDGILKRLKRWPRSIQVRPS